MSGDRKQIRKLADDIKLTVENNIFENGLKLYLSNDQWEMIVTALRAYAAEKE